MQFNDMFNKNSLLFLSSVLFIFPLNAKAVDDEIPSLQIHGYVTQGYSRILSQLSNNSNGYGTIDKSGTFLYNSLLGLNLSYTFNEKITFYGQLTTAGSYFSSGAVTSSYPVSVDMAMLNFHPFDWVDIRIGRQIMPTWMVSEQIDVGVTYPWIRPPMDVYNLAPLKSATGLGVDVKHDLFDIIDAQIGARVGQGTFTEPNTYAAPVDLDRVFIGYGELNFKNMLKLRSSYGSTYATSRPRATPLISLTNPTTAGLTGESIYKSEFTFYSFGSSLDWHNFVLMGEYAATNQKIDSIEAATSGFIAGAPTGGNFKLSSWYATAAYHFGDWTPHFTYSTVEKNLNNANYEGITGFSTNPTVNSITSAAVASKIRANAQSTQAKYTYMAGLNYNFTPTIVGKMQFEQTRTSVSEGGPATVSFINSPTLTSSDIINIFESAVSFVF